MIVDVEEGEVEDEVEEIPVGLIEVVEVGVIIILIRVHGHERGMNNVEPPPQNQVQLNKL